MHQRRIILSGPMGAGKTSVGRALTKDAPETFVDIDERMVEVSGKPIGALYAELGEHGFRALEERIALDCMHNTQYRVIALGGGTATNREFRHAALREGFLVTLTADLATLESRVRDTDRPLRGALASLLEARHDAYAECHARIDTSNRTIMEVCAAVRSAATTDRIVMPLGSRSYPIDLRSAMPAHLGVTLSEHAPSAVLVVTDENVSRLQQEYLKAACGSIAARTELLVLPAGEPHKNLESVTRVWDAALSANFDRNAMLVAVGGGVVSDLTGFAAATLLRGLRWMSVPSTLLAMVDASVGGKTGFDYAGGKNRIGAFHQPSAVLVDFSLLGTLPPREFCSGAAELLKMALLEGPGGVARFEALMAPFLAGEEDALRQLLGAAVSEKVRIVAADETDWGDRIVLNLGHTLGHALESAGDYTTLLHGEAVGLGLLLEHTFGVRKGWTDAALPAWIRAQLVALGLPTTVDPSLLQASIRFLVTDKKRHGDTIKLPLMQTTGKVIVREVDIHELGQIPAGDF